MCDTLADHLITPQNAAFLLIDYQPAQLAAVRSMDHAGGLTVVAVDRTSMPCVNSPTVSAARWPIPPTHPCDAAHRPDGVLTSTAAVHNKAWTEMFDAFLRKRAQRTGESFVAFDPVADYAIYVDGKPRVDGVRDFLASRGIPLPKGNPDDGPGVETVHGLGNRKNQALLRRIRQEGVEVFAGSRRYLEAARDAGLRRVVVSSSANTAEVLEATGLVTLVEGWIDGLAIAAQGLKGKPAPDKFLAGARCAGVEPGRAAVFEDALAGVEAARTGGFGFVVGVDRTEHADALRAHGADIVVSDLAQLLDGANGEAAR